MQKAVQRSLLHFLQSRLGLSLLVLGFVLCLNTAIGVLRLLVTTSISPLCPHCSQNDYADVLGAGWGEGREVALQTGALLQQVDSYEGQLCAEPIDIVYTWVNGSDPRLLADLAYWKAQAQGDEDALAAIAAAAAARDAAALNATSANSTTEDAEPAAPEVDSSGSSSNRFRDNQELRYSLRSIWKFAPWVRKVWIVTNGHVPSWLDLSHPRVAVVTHEEIFPNRSHLPTFSSPAIETHLHRIPGLARRFIYFNDDVMLGAPVTPDDFITQSGGQKVFLSWNVPNCAPGCPDAWIGDKYCDVACNKAECEFDGGDCVNGTNSGGSDNRYGNWASSRSDYNYGGAAGAWSSNARYCASGCPNNWVGDKVCDRACKNRECAFDGGDCGVDLIRDELMGLMLLPTTRPDQNQTEGQGEGEGEYGSYAYGTDGAEESGMYGSIHPGGVRHFLLPYGTTSLYVNLSVVFPGSILEANHDAPTLVRSAIVTQNLRILTLILYGEEDIEEEEAEGQQQQQGVDGAGGEGWEGATGGGSNTTINASAAASDDVDDDDGDVTPPSPRSPTPPPPLRTVEIFMQGEHEGVVSNVTFRISRPRFPPPVDPEWEAAMLAQQQQALLDEADAELAADAAAAAAVAQSDTRARLADGDAESLIAQAGAAAAADVAATPSIHDDGAHGRVVSNENAQLAQAEVAADQAVAEAEAEEETVAERGAAAAAGGAKRRLLSSFDALVAGIQSARDRERSSVPLPGSRRSATSTPSSPPRKLTREELDKPYAPPAGYQHRRSAYASAPASASSHASGRRASYTLPAQRGALAPARDQLLLPGDDRSDWRSMPVFVESVPATEDIVRGGVRLREVPPGRAADRIAENLWVQHDHSADAADDDHDEAPSPAAPAPAPAPAVPVVESYGWRPSDHALADLITTRKKKELWALEREARRENFLRAFRKGQREKERERRGVGWHEEEAHEDEYDPDSLSPDSLRDPSSLHSPHSSRSRPPLRRPRLSQEPLWPWELDVVAPDLFEEWDWAAEARRATRAAEGGVKSRRARGGRKRRAGGKGLFGADVVEEEEAEEENEPSVELSIFGGRASPPQPTDLARPPSHSPRVPRSKRKSPSPPLDLSPRPFGSGGPRRQLLDLYGDSLRFVNNLYTREFGRGEVRKAPAHMPHFIDVGIQTELQSRWPHLFDATSSHRFRHGTDMQYAFTYFYYMMNLPRSFSLPLVFREQLDLDRNGLLNPLEIRYMTLWLSGKRVAPGDLDRMHERLANASRALYGYDHSAWDEEDPPRVDQSVIAAAPEVLELLADKWESLRRYKFELVDLDQIEFYMVPDNATKVQTRLDEIRAKAPKFVCLNDDMNKTADPPSETLQALRDFYLSYFPTPCPFEHPPGVENAFQYMEQYRDMQEAAKGGVLSRMVRGVATALGGGAGGGGGDGWATSAKTTPSSPALTALSGMEREQQGASTGGVSWLLLTGVPVGLALLLAWVLPRTRLWPKIRRMLRRTHLRDN